MRGQMRLMLCLWFNVQGFKARNAWKSQYQQRVANRSKSKSQASMMRNKHDDIDEEFLSNPLAETRALQRPSTSVVAFNALSMSLPHTVDSTYGTFSTSAPGLLVNGPAPGVPRGALGSVGTLLVSSLTTTH